MDFLWTSKLPAIPSFHFSDLSSIHHPPFLLIPLQLAIRPLHHKAHFIDESQTYGPNHPAGTLRLISKQGQEIAPHWLHLGGFIRASGVGLGHRALNSLEPSPSFIHYFYRHSHFLLFISSAMPTSLSCLPSSSWKRPAFRGSLARPHRGPNGPWSQTANPCAPLQSNPCSPECGKIKEQGNKCTKIENERRTLVTPAHSSRLCHPLHEHMLRSLIPQWECARKYRKARSTVAQ